MQVAHMCEPLKRCEQRGEAVWASRRKRAARNALFRYSKRANRSYVTLNERLAAVLTLSLKSTTRTWSRMRLRSVLKL